MKLRARVFGLCAAFGVPLQPGFAAPSDAPVAAYASHLLAADRDGPRHVQHDIAVRRSTDGAIRVFDFDRMGARDTAAIARFLRGASGRVVRVFDQVGGHDLVPPPGTVGPLINPAMTTAGLPGLLFDNGGAFEGNPPVDGKRYYAVALQASGFDLSLARGVATVAALRLGNVETIAAAPLLALGAASPAPFQILAGNPSLDHRTAGDDRMTALYGRLFPIGPPPASTPSRFALTADSSGTTTRIDAVTTNVERALPVGATWTDILLGSTVPGGGAGWQLDALRIYDHRLSPSALAAASAAIAQGTPANPRLTIVLDGSSVEAGVGSTGLRNLTRLYEPFFPGARIFNVAAGGASSADRLAALPGTLALVPRDGSAAVLVDGTGANSLAHGVPAATTYAQASAYVAAAHAARPGLRVGLTTIIPLAYGIAAGDGPAFDAYNAMVRRNQAGADFIIDRASDPIMGSVKTIWPRVDRTYSTDGGHPADAGYAILARIDATAIAEALRGKVSDRAPTLPPRTPG